MARQATAAKEETANIPAVVEDLYAGFSDEEKAELLEATGQINSLQADRIALLKINYTDLEGQDGRSIKKGNFVLGQSSKEVQDGDNIVLEDIGIDMGKNPEITILTYGQQYSFYHADKAKRCNSQVVTETNEQPVGSTLGFECRSGKCPRRSEGVDKSEKCTCQWVIYATVKVPDTEEVTKCIMYIKGASFMAFSDYLKSAGTLPICWFPTKLGTKMAKQGSVTYYTIHPELQKERPYPELERRTNFEMAKASKKGAEEYKLALASKKSKPAQLAGPSEGRFAREIVEDDNIDSISFD